MSGRVEAAAPGPAAGPAPFTDDAAGLVFLAELNAYLIEEYPGFGTSGDDDGDDGDSAEDQAPDAGAGDEKPAPSSAVVQRNVYGTFNARGDKAKQAAYDDEFSDTAVALTVKDTKALTSTESGRRTLDVGAVDWLAKHGGERDVMAHEAGTVGGTHLVARANAKRTLIDTGGGGGDFVLNVVWMGAGDCDAIPTFWAHLQRLAEDFTEAGVADIKIHAFDIVPNQRTIKLPPLGTPKSRAQPVTAQAVDKLNRAVLPPGVTHVDLYVALRCFFNGVCGGAIIRDGVSKLVPTMLWQPGAGAGGYTLPGGMLLLGELLNSAVHTTLALDKALILHQLEPFTAVPTAVATDGPKATVRKNKLFAFVRGEVAVDGGGGGGGGGSGGGDGDGSEADALVSSAVLAPAAAIPPSHLELVRSFATLRKLGDPLPVAATGGGGADYAGGVGAGSSADAAALTSAAAVGVGGATSGGGSSGGGDGGLPSPSSVVSSLLLAAPRRDRSFYRKPGGYVPLPPETERALRGATASHVCTATCDKICEAYMDEVLPRIHTLLLLGVETSLRFEGFKIVYGAKFARAASVLREAELASLAERELSVREHYPDTDTYTKIVDVAHKHNCLLLAVHMALGMCRECRGTVGASGVPFSLEYAEDMWRSAFAALRAFLSLQQQSTSALGDQEPAAAAAGAAVSSRHPPPRRCSRWSCRRVRHA